MNSLEKIELTTHMTTLVSGVLKIIILIVALLALQEGRQERKDAAAARTETLKILSFCAACVDGTFNDEVADPRRDDSTAFEDFSEVKR